MKVALDLVGTFTALQGRFQLYLMSAKLHMFYVHIQNITPTAVFCRWCHL